MKEHRLQLRGGERFQAQGPEARAVRFRSSHFGLLSALFVLALCCWLAPSPSPAQFLPPENTALRSYSGQFVIQSVRDAGSGMRVSRLETNRNCIPLERTVLTVSCERIKQHLWHALEATAPWQGKIFVNLYPARSAEDEVFITAEKFRDTWMYRLELPDVVERTRYVRGLVQVLLLELANRKAQERSAEIPVWLVEGLTRQLLAANGREIILPPPRASTGKGLGPVPTIVSERRKDSLEAAHRVLASGEPLSFEQLSWLQPDKLEAEAGERYRCSAQLLVSELLRLNNGPASLRTLLEILPGYYNWQFAFLKAFEAEFQRPIDVEKWWTLHLMQFTGRNLDKSWTTEESRQKLDEVIRSAVQMRAGTNELPAQGEVRLQTVLRQWNREQQTALLQNKLRELELVRLRLAPELIPFADEYRLVIATFLKDRNRRQVPLLSSKKAAARHAADQAVQQLDVLDARLRGRQPTPNLAGAQPGAVNSQP